MKILKCGRDGGVSGPEFEVVGSAPGAAERRREEVARLADEAAMLFAAAEGERAAVGFGMRKALERAWQCGQRLNEIKELVGHGNWVAWFEQWQGRLERKGLGALNLRTAQRWMQIDRDNPGATRVEDLCMESVRKYSLGFVPEKDRPEHEGDAAVARPLHHLTLVNIGMKFRRQIEAGHAKLDPEEARRDLRPLWEWLCELYQGEN